MKVNIWAQIPAVLNPLTLHYGGGEVNKRIQTKLISAVERSDIIQNAAVRTGPKGICWPACFFV